MPLPGADQSGAARQQPLDSDRGQVELAEQLRPYLLHRCPFACRSDGEGRLGGRDLGGLGAGHVVRRAGGLDRRCCGLGQVRREGGRQLAHRGDRCLDPAQRGPRGRDLGAEEGVRPAAGPGADGGCCRAALPVLAGPQHGFQRTPRRGDDPADLGQPVGEHDAGDAARRARAVLDGGDLGPAHAAAVSCQREGVTGLELAPFGVALQLGQPPPTALSCRAESHKTSLPY